MDVRFSNGRTETVRLLGVDTPEVYAENRPSEWDGVPQTTAGSEWLHSWGTRASEFATEKLSGETVTIRTDPRADRRGSYGRLLVYLSVPDESQSFNWQLLNRGYARLYDTPFTQRDEFAATERRARDSGTGVWGFSGEASDEPTVATETVSLALVEVNADAAGNDNENLDDEFLVFENTGTEPLDLSGWTVSDSAGHTYRLPEGLVLNPGDRLRLTTGPGTTTETTLYWGRTSAVWNNGGDTIIVRTSGGELVLRESY
ncbi:lamin tail domain-containing protein [Salinigranum halophilum]|uniref:lamin tail domain-containing protein n=1 Tax=Salinigranum halophilum TaxID=2565931 RepID=UPI0013763385|nr:lamin tail domain-containing protein [Salinigranum halophilum]